MKEISFGSPAWDQPWLLRWVPGECRAIPSTRRVFPTLFSALMVHSRLIGGGTRLLDSVSAQTRQQRIAPL